MSNYYEHYWKRKTRDELEDLSFKWPIISGLIPKEKELVLLDYGCGNGKILSEIAKINPKSTLIGIDVSKNALKKAKKKIPDAKLYLTHDGKKLSLKPASVDFITALDVVEHIYDTPKIFSEFGRVLRPGGKILITTPYHGLLKNLIICVFGFEKIFDPTGPHIRFFTARSLTRCLKDVNLKVLSKGYYGRFFPVSRGMYLIAQKKALTKSNQKRPR